MQLISMCSTDNLWLKITDSPASIKNVFDNGDSKHALSIITFPNVQIKCDDQFKGKCFYLHQTQQRQVGFLQNNRLEKCFVLFILG